MHRAIARPPRAPPLLHDSSYDTFMRERDGWRGGHRPRYGRSLTACHPRLSTGGRAGGRTSVVLDGGTRDQPPNSRASPCSKHPCSKCTKAVGVCGIAPLPPQPSSPTAPAHPSRPACTHHPCGTPSTGHKVPAHGVHVTQSTKT